MVHTGLISKINTELKYGFITVANLGKVFISNDTDFGDMTFDQLTVGLNVYVLVKQTERGLFAESLSLKSHASKMHKNYRLPEASI